MAAATTRRQAARHTVRHVYRKHFDARRERLLVSASSFLVTFAVVRSITYSIRLDLGPFHNVSAGGVHVHHLVWGILGLLAIGYLWLARLGEGGAGASRAGSVATAIAFGVAAALTLDEFALWFNLADVYWSRQGRESVYLVILFGCLLWIGWLAGPFVLEVRRELRALRREWRRR